MEDLRTFPSRKYESIVNLSDFVNVTLRGDHIQETETRWDELLFSIKEVPHDNILERLKNEDTGFRVVQDQAGPRRSSCLE